MHHGTAQPVAIFDRVTRRLQPRADQLRKDILFGKLFGGDDDPALVTPAALRPQRGEDAQHHHRHPAKGLDA